jgi:hypothetical protein
MPTPKFFYVIKSLGIVVQHDASLDYQKADRQMKIKMTDFYIKS